MSSSFHKRSPGLAAKAVSACSTGLLAVSAPLYAPAIPAAETYIVPAAEVGAEYHSDLGLQSPSSSDEESAEGYFADLSAVAGIRSPRSFVELRPRVRFQEYPDREELEKSNEYLDLRTGYDSLRSSFGFVADYRNEDEVRAEIAEAQFDDLNPDDPIVDETGRAALGATRQRIQLRPKYTHRLSQRLGLGASAVYQDVSFDSAGGSREDYAYWRGDAFADWMLSQRTVFRTGAFVTRFETDDELNETDSIGASLGVEHQWSETFALTAALEAEETDTRRAGFENEESSTDVGATVGIVRRTQVSELRFDGGRTFNPTGLGARFEVDQIRVQYERNLTERLQLGAAARAYRSRAQGGNRNDRDFLRTDIGFGWSLTPTWTVRGGYSYIQEDFESERTDRSDNMLMLSVRYQSLGPQR